MLRVLIVWIIGIFACKFLDQLELWVILGFLTFFILLYGIFYKLLFESLFLLLGLFILSIIFNQPSFEKNRLSPKGIDALVIRVDEPSKSKPKSWETVATITQYRKNKQWFLEERVRKIKCYFSKKIKGPRVGQFYLLADTIRDFEKPVFPFEKDWGTYFRDKGIVGYVFLHAKNQKIIQPLERVNFKYFLKKYQNFGISALSTMPTLENREVAEAMVLGETQGIDAELQEAYSYLGAIHILSVSGMHLALLFALLNAIFAAIQKVFPSSKLLCLLVLLALLWFYAGVTGFSAPVLRATSTFTILLLGKYFRQNINSLNLLASSCFLLLLFEPKHLFQTGFQLSYVAVLGLLLFQKPILNLWQPQKTNLLIKISYFFWESTAVGISAQLLTFPLIIYYFHQYPNVWINLLINPFLMVLSSLALFISFFQVAVYGPFLFFNLTILNQWMGLVADWIYAKMHQFMLFFAHLKSAVYSFLDMEIHDVVFLYLLLILLILWIKLRKSYLLLLFNLMLVCVVFTNEYKHADPKLQKFVGKYVFRKEFVEVQIRGELMAVWATNSFVKDRRWFSSHLLPFASKMHIQDTILYTINQPNNQISRSGNR